MAIWTENNMPSNTLSDTNLQELILAIQKRLEFPEERVRKILASALHFIELKHPEYLPIVHQLGFDVLISGKDNQHESFL